MCEQLGVLLHTSVTSLGPMIRLSFFADASFRSRTVGLWYNVYYGIGMVQSYTKYGLGDIRQIK